MALVGITACGGGREARVVPDVRGQRLDRAERLLADQRLDWDEQGSDGLGVLVRSNWTVCGQTPPPGKLARRVVLHVGKRCGRQSPATSRAPRMPWVESSNLHDAEEQLDSAGIAYTVRTDDGDPVVIERLWTVCYQTPAGGTRARFVELQVAHECWE
jgi:hypothetical protein